MNQDISSGLYLGCLLEPHGLSHYSHCFFSAGFCFDRPLSGDHVEVSSVIGIQKPSIGLSDANQAT